MILKSMVGGAVIAMALGASGCGGKNTEAGGTAAGAAEGTVATASAPTKEALLAQLQVVAVALEKGETAGVTGHFVMPPDANPEEIEGALKGLLEKKEISSAGLKIFADKGTFGTLAEVFPEKGASRAERMKLNPAECYGMKLDDGEVMAHWTGTQFKIFRLDDIGKLGAPAAEPAAEPVAE